MEDIRFEAGPATGMLADALIEPEESRIRTAPVGEVWRVENVASPCECTDNDPTRRHFCGGIGRAGCHLARRDLICHADMSDLTFFGADGQALAWRLRRAHPTRVHPLCGQLLGRPLPSIFTFRYDTDTED